MPDESQPPRRKSFRRLFATSPEAARVSDAQNKILDGLFQGITNLLKKYFEEARDVVRIAILHATVDVYNDGISHGRGQASVLFHAYLAVVLRKLIETARDPRVDLELPEVTAEELHAAMATRGAALSVAEVAELAAKLTVTLALPID